MSEPIRMELRMDPPCEDCKAKDAKIARLRAGYCEEHEPDSAKPEPCGACEALHQADLRIEAERERDKWREHCELDASRAEAAERERDDALDLAENRNQELLSHAQCEHPHEYKELVEVLGREEKLEARVKELEGEGTRWQDAIYKLVKELSGSDVIDGGGCDSGDPLEYTLAEIREGFNYVKEREAPACDECGECDDCDGSGVYYINDEPQVCICVGEKKSYQDLEAEIARLRDEVGTIRRSAIAAGIVPASESEDHDYLICKSFGDGKLAEREVKHLRDCHKTQVDRADKAERERGEAWVKLDIVEHEQNLAKVAIENSGGTSVSRLHHAIARLSGRAHKAEARVKELDAKIARLKEELEATQDYAILRGMLYFENMHHGYTVSLGGPISVASGNYKTEESALAAIDEAVRAMREKS